MVLQLAEQRGEVTRKAVVELLHITPSQAYRILQRLLKDGELTLQGRGAGAKYIWKKK